MQDAESTDALVDDLLCDAAIQDPHPYLAALRAHDPVHFSEAHSAWLVTSYEHVVAALTDPRLSSDRVSPLLEHPSALDPSAEAVLRLLQGWMVLSDPPAHTRLRKAAARAFNPPRIMAMESQIAELVDELLDEFIDRGHSDLIAHFAYPLPATVICELLGAPARDRELFRRWSDDLALVAFGAGGHERAERHRRALEGLEALFGYFGELIAHARAHPRADNMVSALVQPSDGRLSEPEVKAMCALMLFAGHETTTSAISSGVLALIDHPDQLARLRASPAAIPSAVEEILRFDGPIKVLIRSVTEDVRLGGSLIRAGERVFLSPAAANRDPKRFASPDRFDVGRTPNPHIAFGKGIHACIGAQLARLEMKVALARIIARLPGLRLAPGTRLRWQAKLASRALEALPIDHDATPAGVAPAQAR